jgi:hypothetical protein
MRWRFSLRTLFVVTTLFAGLCYLLILPSIHAEQFVRAVTKQNYELADSFFHDQQDRFLSDWNEKHWRFKTGAKLGQWSLGEFVRGERQVRLSVMYGDAGPMRTSEWTVVATRAGLSSLEPAMASSGVGGIAI